MNITKEELRSLIREQMSNVSEVADDDVPMMPPKPVKPKGIAGTDVPVASLSDGFDAAREAVEAMYSPTDRRYISAMMVIDMAEKQDQEKTQDKEQTRSDRAPGGDDHLGYLYDFVTRSSELAGEPQPKNPLPNPFRVTKEHLQRIIKEELLIVMEDLGPAAKTASRAAKRSRDDLKRAVAKSPMRQGRNAARAGGDKEYPKEYTEKQKESFDKGWDDEKSIMADEKKMKGESLEKTSVNEQ
jgi:hypothetical protein